jgi:hypothetical protein
MKRQYILYRRKLGGKFYIEDTHTRKQESLGTSSNSTLRYDFGWTAESLLRRKRRRLMRTNCYIVQGDASCLSLTGHRSNCSIHEPLFTQPLAGANGHCLLKFRFRYETGP